jgi:multidrug resistance efflux pump
MNLSVLLLAVVLAPGQTAAARTDRVELPNCFVRLIEEAEVPAQEPGVLKAINVREGEAVKPGDLLAQIDDAKTQAELNVAKAKLKAADEKAKDDISVRYAKAAAKTAQAEYDFNDWANKQVRGSVPQVRLNELALKCEETRLGIDKSKLEQRVAGDEADAAKAEVDAAEENIRRRQIRAPLGGVVVAMHRHQGEWVQAGDQVLRVIHMDKLWVDGYLDASKFSRAEIEDRPVTVSVKLVRDQEVSLPGKVVFASPTTEAGGKFLVRAEVANQQNGGHWVFSPGLTATMSIPLK